MAASSRAGASLLQQLLERGAELAPAPGHGGQAEAFAALVAALAASAAVRPALLLSLEVGEAVAEYYACPRLKQWYGGARSTGAFSLPLPALLQALLRLLAGGQAAAVRRCWLDALGHLLGHCLGRLAQWRPHAQALLAALTQGLADRDANLRAKAAACLSKHAAQLAPLLEEAPAAAEPLLRAICARSAAAGSLWRMRRISE